MVYRLISGQRFCAGMICAGVVVASLGAMAFSGETDCVSPADEKEVKAVATVAEGRLTVAQESELLLSAVLENPAAATEVTDLHVHSLAGGYEALDIVLAGAHGPYRAIAVGRQNGGYRLVWEGGIRKGDPGERYWDDVAFIREADCSVAGLYAGVRYEGAVLCDGTIPLIFQQKYNPRKRQFETIVAGRPPMADTEIDGTIVRDLEEETVVSFPRLLQPRAVSSVLGDRATPLLLTPPYALVDGNPDSGWSPNSFPGTGEFVSFSTVSSRFAITGLVVEVPPQRYRNGGSRPKTLVLQVNGRTVRLVVPPMGRRVQFVFDEPVKTDCLTLFVDRVYPSGSRKRPVHLLEVVAQTKMDGHISELVATLDDDSVGEDALRLLRTIPRRGVEAVIAQWPDLSATGKRRGVRLLVDMPSEKSAAMLTEMAMVTDDPIAPMAASGVQRLGASGARALTPYLESSDEKKRGRAIRMLVNMDSDAAFSVLLTSLGAEWQANRPVVVALNTLLGRDATRETLLLEALHDRRKEVSDAENDAILTALIEVAAGKKNTAETAAQIARDRFMRAEEFAPRYVALRHFVSAETTLDTPKDAVPEPVVSAVRDADAHMRELGVVALGRLAQLPEARELLFAALEDEAPNVRIAALVALGGARVKDDGDRILILLGDEWPQVRALVVRYSSVFFSTAQTRVLMTGLRDDSFVVVLEALEQVAGLPATGVADDVFSEILVRLLSESEMRSQVVEAAIRAVGARCHRDSATVDALFRRLEAGADPRANRATVRLGIAAAQSLGRMGTQNARKALQKARRRSTPVMDRAIDAALAIQEPACL